MCALWNLNILPWNSHWIDLLHMPWQGSEVITEHVTVFNCNVTSLDCLFIFDAPSIDYLTQLSHKHDLSEDIQG